MRLPSKRNSIKLQSPPHETWPTPNQHQPMVFPDLKLLIRQLRTSGDQDINRRLCHGCPASQPPNAFSKAFLIEIIRCYLFGFSRKISIRVLRFSALLPCSWVDWHVSRRPAPWKLFSASACLHLRALIAADLSLRAIRHKSMLITPLSEGMQSVSQFEGTQLHWKQLVHKWNAPWMEHLSGSKDTCFMTPFRNISENTYLFHFKV